MGWSKTIVNAIAPSTKKCDRRYFGFLRWGRNQVSEIVILPKGFFVGQNKSGQTAVCPYSILDRISVKGQIMG
jgi:hypothetical protein